jgi:hypothetical protein
MDKQDSPQGFSSALKAPAVDLFFSGALDPELFRMQIHHPRLQRSQLSVRGKGEGAHLQAGSFQWTSAVRAMAILLCRSAAVSQRGQSPVPLIGAAGTPASTLDYSMAKNTQWLADSFGCDSRGNVLWPAFFRRSNPNRKRGGPAAILLRPGVSVSIIWQGRKLEEAEQLFQLSSLLEQSWRKRYAKSLVRHSDNLLGETLLKQIRISLFAEVSSAILTTDIFSPKALRESIASITQNRNIKRIVGSGINPVSDFDLHLSSQQRLGMRKPTNFPKKPLKIAVPAPMPATHAIFEHLNSERRNFIVDASHVHAVELAKLLLKDGGSKYDLLCLGIAPAASLLSAQSSHDYQPLMLLPRVSQRIVCSATDQNPDLDGSDYMIIKDEPSIPSFILDEMFDLGAMTRSKVDINHREPDEVFSELADGEEGKRALLFFPHYNFNQWLNGCRFVDDPRAKANNQECILFARKELVVQRGFAECLCASVRYSWLELRASASTREKIVSRINQEDRYSKLLARCGGLHHHLDEAA